MSGETEGMLEITWNIDWSQLHSLKKGETITSPPIEADRLKGTKWFLSLRRSILVLLYKEEFEYDFNLNRSRLDNYEKDIRVSYKLEITDMRDNTIDFERLCSFSKGSYAWQYLKEEDFKCLKRDSFIRLSDKLTIHCHITEVQQAVSANHEQQEVTKASKGGIPLEIQTLMSTFKWKVRGDDLLKWSKTIKVPFSESNDFDIIITKAACEEKISIKVIKVDILQPYELKIIALNDRNMEISNEDSKYLSSTDKSEKFVTLIDKRLVEDTSCYPPSYSFTLICIISTSSGNSVPEIESDSSGKTSPHLKSRPLQEDLNAMLLSEKHSDVKLRSNGQFLHAHKCLLSARSPVFSVMFDQDMVENQTGIVDIPDVESNVLRYFLEFLYTDTIANTTCEEVLKLMLVADKYQVNALKERCSRVLKSKLSEENIYEVVALADMVNESNLKQFAINFIKANKKKIISSPVWRSWMEKNTKLANEILTELIID